MPGQALAAFADAQFAFSLYVRVRTVQDLQDRTALYACLWADGRMTYRPHTSVRRSIHQLFRLVPSLPQPAQSQDRATVGQRPRAVSV